MPKIKELKLKFINMTYYKNKKNNNKKKKKNKNIK
jgi:hypothetical protein